MSARWWLVFFLEFDSVRVCVNDSEHMKAICWKFPEACLYSGIFPLVDYVLIHACTHSLYTTNPFFFAAVTGLSTKSHKYHPSEFKRPFNTRSCFSFHNGSSSLIAIWQIEIQLNFYWQNKMLTLPITTTFIMASIMTLSRYSHGEL